MAKKTKQETPEQAVARLSAEFSGSEPQKEEIRALMADAGLESELREGCSQCWQDALALLRNHYGIKAEDVAAPKPEGRVKWL